MEFQVYKTMNSEKEINDSNYPMIGIQETGILRSDEYRRHVLTPNQMHQQEIEIKSYKTKNSRKNVLATV